jgi:DNA-binding beta-propeller fold protein YncE
MFRLLKGSGRSLATRQRLRFRPRLQALEVRCLLDSSVRFFDGIFTDAYWTATKVIDTTSGQGAFFDAHQVSSGGNPGAFRYVLHSYDTGDIGVAHLRTGFEYDPSRAGPISGIDYSYDLIHLNPPPGQAVQYNLLLAQGGCLYQSSRHDLIFTQAWTSFAHTGLGATDFIPVGSCPTEQPDFSSSGSAIQLGYYSWNESTGGRLFRISGIDNWSVTVNQGEEMSHPRLLVSSFAGSDVQRYDGTTGAFIDEFIPPGSGGLDGVHKVGLGNDGNLLVSSTDGHAVLRYNSATGTFLGQFVTTGSGGIDRPHTWAFGPDGNLYVSDNVGGGGIYRYDGMTGNFINVFVAGGSGGLDAPAGIVFGPDDNLYVNDFGLGSSVMRYDGTTGKPLPAEGQTGAFFVAPGSLQYPNLGITFGTDGNLYVGNFGGNSVNRYDGATGEPLPAPGQTGAFFVPPGSGGLSSAHGIAFGPDGNLYISSEGTNQVLRYDGTTGAFLNAFVNRMGVGGPSGLFFSDTDAQGPPSISNRSHGTSAGVSHRTAELDPLVVFANGFTSHEGENIFSSVSRQAVGAGLPVSVSQAALPEQAFAVPVSASGLYRHALSAQRHRDEVLFAGHLNESATPVTSDWLCAGALDGVGWDLA